MKKVIFFDLDGTLIAGRSWYEFNLYFGMSHDEDQVMFDWYSRGIITYDEWNDIIVKILKEKNTCTIDAIAEFNKTLIARDGATELIQTCKDKGYTTIILSGAIQQVAEGVRLRLGADLSYTASKIIFDENGLLETIMHEKDEGPAKLKIFEKLCTEHGTDPSDTMYVGDSRNDLEIFEKTKKGILLGTYEKLEPLAWKQIIALDEVIDLL